MEKMTSRERVMRSLNHQEPDRVPLDIGGGYSTTIVAEGYERLKRHLGVTAATKMIDETFRLVRVDEAVAVRLGSDTRPLLSKGPSNWTPPPSPPGTSIDIWGITWKQVYYGDGCYYWESIGHPLAEATIEDLECYPWPDPLDPGYTAGVAEEARSLHEGTTHAIVADGGFKAFWELAFLLRGLEQLLMDLVENPEFVEALLAKLLEINLAGTARFLDLAGRYIQVFRTADDLATQQGLLMSPATFRRLLKPVYKQFFGFVKSRTEAKIFYHSCGNVTGLLDDFIEIGVDAINPVQVSAMGDTRSLKARFGDRVTFWGGIDTQHALPHGSVSDVEAEVRLRIRDLAPGGGYVLASVHNMQPDVPPKNIVAMAEATRRYGVYPLEKSACQN
jgi:uroporphyrinogen decarboxylase